ncbi:mechanosensitive ion channel family protein [Timonella sp. A28]|uniref:mechanosensitive ion channel family protein n=1 Tax=Timonella sp. A28 TaxID=3442640 RepID=UPI003EB999AF
MYLPTLAVFQAASNGDHTATFLGKTAAQWWEFFLDVPLSILIIVVLASVVLVISRKLIKNLSERIANGTDKPLFGSSEIGRSLLTTNPLTTARRAQRARTIGSVLRSTVSVIVGASAVLMIMDTLRIPIAPLLASAGVVGVALGFGAQSLVKDFLSGTFLILEDQYGVGDKVTIGDVQGTVESVALRVTKVRDGDGTLWYLRNGDVLKVGNKTHGWAVAAIEVNVPYTCDLNTVRETLADAAHSVKNDPEVGRHIRGVPTVSGIESMSATTLSLTVQARTEPAQQWEVSRALREKIREEMTAKELPLA